MEQSNENLTPNSFMKNLTIIYIALLAGMVMFGLVIVFLTDVWESTLPSTDDPFLYAVPVLTFLGVVLGRVIHKKFMDKLQKTESLKDKLIGYQTACIIKYALVEMPFLVGVVGALLTNNIYYLMISGTLVMYYITLRPTRIKVKEDLSLTTKMGLQFNEKNQVLN